MEIRAMRTVNIFAFLLLFAGQSLAVEIQDLSGPWRFSVDAEDQGVRQQWFAKELADTIRLPGTTDQTGVGDDAVSGGRHDELWHQLRGCVRVIRCGDVR